MGQVVTETFVDYSTGELVVRYGHCCEERYSLLALIGGGFIDPDTGEPPIPTDPPPQGGTYTACAKAKSLHDVWRGAIDVLFDAAEEQCAPHTAVGRVEDAYPQVKWGHLSLWNAYTAALPIAALGLVSETEGADSMQRLLCRWVRRLSDDGVGIDEDTYKALRSMTQDTANEEFHLINYPLSWSYMVDVWFWTFDAIGKNDARDLTTGIVDDGLIDCGCPDASDPGGSLDPVDGYYLGANLAESQRKDTSEYWKHNGVRALLPDDAYGVVVKIANVASNTIKRMEWDADAMGVSAEVSIWTDGSDHLESSGFHEGALLVYFADSAIGFNLAETLEEGQVMIFKEAGDGVLGAALAASGQIFGGMLDSQTDIDIVQWRVIYKEES